MKGLPKYLCVSIWCLIGIVYIAGLFLDVMDIDAAQYATIAKEMFYNNSYLEVYLNGKDYLDKPPLLFWLGAFSFHVFGVHDWAFRLPSLLITVLGVYSTFRFTKLFYSLTTAQLATLLIAACQAFFLMNHDVRTDSILTGFVMFTFWQMAEFDRSLKLKHILLVGLGIGLAMLSKGPIGLVVPGTAFFFHYVLKREWEKIFRWQYLLALVVIAFVLFPMSYGLYTQYDLHPEKVVYELQGPSGLRFFYWTQSFGRITGEIYWDNDPDTFFLVHNFLWSFLPWSGLFLIGLVVGTSEKIKKLMQGDKSIEWITTSGFILIFIFLSLSRYQLPHYTFVIHPLAAIILADFLNNKLTENRILKNICFGLLILTLCILVIGAWFLFGVYLKENLILSFFILGMGIIFALYLFLNKNLNLVYRLILPGVIIIASMNVILNTITYPQLFTFQSESVIAKDINRLSGNLSKESKLIYYKMNPSYSPMFYSDGKIERQDSLAILKQMLIKGKTWVVTDSLNATDLISQTTPGSEKIYYSHPVSILTGKFLNPETRDQTLKPVYLFAY